MKSHKIVALILAMVMLLALFTGCNTTASKETKTNETQSGTSSESKKSNSADKPITFPLAEPMELSVMYTLGNASYPVVDHVVWKKLQELSGFTFKTTEFAPADASEKMNLLMSSGEYSEVIFKCSKIDTNKYGADGLILPLEDLIRQYMPNLTAVLNERDAWNEVIAPDGHIYNLPQFNDVSPNVGNGAGWWINKAWLDKLNLSMPTSLDELYTVLKAFKEKDPNGNGKADEIPMATFSDQEMLNILLSLTGEGLSYNDYWMVVDGQMEYLPATDFFKDTYLKFMNKLYSEGLVNQDLFTIDRDQFRASCAAEEVIYGFLCDSSCVYFANEDEQLNWVLLPPFDSTNFSLGKGVSTGGLALTDKCQHPDIVLSFFDYLYTQEGGALPRMGVAGESYKLYEDGTWEYDYDKMENPIYQGTLMGTSSVPALIPDMYYNLPASVYTRHLNQQWHGEDGLGSKGTLVPPVTLSVEENDEYSVLFTDISAYMKNYAAECITGITDIDASWSEFQSTLKQMKVDRMVEIQRNAYARAVG